MSTFPPVGPRGDAAAAYPTADKLDRAEILARLPLRWAGGVALLGALLTQAGCSGFLIFRAHPETEVTEETEINWGSGLMGDVAGEYWYQVTEDEAWAVVEAALHAQGYETLREIRTTSGDQAAQARVLAHEESGDEVLVAFQDWGVEMYRDSPEYSTTEGACAVTPGADGCATTTCGEPASSVDEACAVLGVFPSGEYWSWSEVPEHDRVLEEATGRFLAWARAQGHVP